MKKQAKRLSLSRETLHLLERDNLTEANGAIINPSRAAGTDCTVNVCPSLTCQFTTCY